jgi:cytochrome c553
MAKQAIVKGRPRTSNPRVRQVKVSLSEAEYQELARHAKTQRRKISDMAYVILSGDLL